MADWEQEALDAKPVVIYGYDGSAIKKILTDSTGILKTLNFSGLVPEVFDYVAPSYTGDNMTGVVYKTGGAGGTTVATLTIAYDGSDNITSITRT